MTLTLKAKMLGAVLSLALLSVVLAILGVMALDQLNVAVKKVDEASTRMELLAQAQVHVAGWIRDVEFLSSETATAQQISKIRETAREDYRLINDALDKLYDLLQFEESKREVKKARDMLSEYKKVEKTVNTFYDQGKYIDVDKEIVQAVAIGDRIVEELQKIVERNDSVQRDVSLNSQKEYDSARSTLVVVPMIGIAIFAGAAVWVIVFGVSRPLEAVTQAIRTVANGHYDITVPGRGRDDEIGSLASALETFKQNGIDKQRLEREQERTKQELEENRRRSMGKLADNFESSVKAVVRTVTQAAEQMQRSAQGLSSSAEEANRRAVTVAAASEQASCNVATVASATEELSSSVNEISRQVSESAHIATVAVEEANRTNVTVASLSEAAQKIGEVVGLINNIASQTNLLALNATIEAARAGEAGKGFAVVASEVKNLANQTAKATDDIQVQVGQMQTVTGTAVEAIKGISSTIRRMSEITTTIASAVEEQGATTREIARNVQQAATGTHEVSQNIAGVTQAAAETGQMAGDVLGAASELNRQAELLQREVDGFIHTIRSA
ncbi:methyl-accepting chemotaxis protein [Azospirillaceae bacterium]